MIEKPAPSGDHPMWARRPDAEANSRSGADTWRCKECHGWDYKGKDGAYAKGSITPASREFAPWKALRPPSSSRSFVIARTVIRKA